MKHCFLALMLFINTACSASELSPRERAIAEKIEGILQSDPCEANRPGDCPKVEVTAPAPRLPSADEEVILIIDEKMEVASLALHANRVIAHFKAADAPDYYRPYRPSVRFPKGADQILHEVFKGQTEMASSRGLRELGERFGARYSRLIGDGFSMGHGTTSFNILAELNPRARFVVVHNDDTFHVPPLCALGERGGEEKLARYWRERGEAIARIAREYRVRWVNYSMGWDAPQVREHWSQWHCRGSYPAKEKIRAFMLGSNAIPRALASLPGLLFVQSAAYAAEGDPETLDRDYPADCEAIPGRLRVGYLNREADRLSPEESRDLSLLTDDMRNVSPCADLFVRDGLLAMLRPTASPIHYTGLGFGHGAMNVPGTSFIAPVGLSYAAERMRAEGLTPERLLRRLRGERDEPLLVAPFRQREFGNRAFASYLNWP